MLGGPNFETVAEIRMLKICGVDAVGKKINGGQFVFNNFWPVFLNRIFHKNLIPGIAQTLPRFQLIYSIHLPGLGLPKN